MAIFRRGRWSESEERTTAGLSDADLVWNRAAMERGGKDPRPGDSALAALLRIHSIAMNGGLLHSVDNHSEEELSEGVSGFRYFGLVSAADVVEWVRSKRESALDDDALDALECDADGRYADVVPNDSTLVAAFEERFRSDPSAFAPVSSVA